MENKRLLSLDALRGFTIAAMILVNNPGTWEHVYSPLLHAEWNGLTPTDLIFPFFLFIVGVSIVLAYTKRKTEGVKPSGIFQKILFRSIKIFAVGVLLSFIFTRSFVDLRIVGVLQRIALVFLVCSFLFLLTKWRTQLIIGGALLLVYWITMMFIPTPGYGKVMLEPGANIAAWIDSFIVPGKMWRGTWDPEGFYSTLPAIATGIFGMMAGKIITDPQTQEGKIIWLFSIGTLACIVGYIWGLHFPVNKNLWTSSYVLVTGGMASIMFALMIFLVDMLNYTKVAKVGIIFGANAITIYVLADLLTFIFYGTKFGSDSLNNYFMNGVIALGSSLKLASFLYALVFIGINFIPAWILYKKKIFIKL
jgi:predicted acyltransferase